MQRMRRIGQWMLNALTALSLVLGIGMAVLWVRSYSTEDVLIWSDGYAPWPESGLNFWGWSVCSARGGVTVATCFYVLGNTGLFSGLGWPIPAGRQLAWQRRPADGAADAPFPYECHGCTFNFKRNAVVDKEFGHTYLAKRVDLPLPLLVALAALLPAARGRQWVRAWQSRGAGKCHQCRYDLTGNLSGICPECGASVAKIAS